MESSRRQEKRIPWRGSIRLVVPGLEPFHATIADISEKGCGVRAEKPIETGAAVGIDGDGFHGSGIVRFCYPAGGLYRIGIELIPVV